MGWAPPLSRRWYSRTRQSSGTRGTASAYLLRNGCLELLTSDHTLAGLLLRSGEMTSTEVQRHAGRAVLSRCVGMERFTYADVQAVRLHSGDRLLLCTDGLTGVIDDDLIRALLCQHEKPDAAAQALVDSAIAAAASDNVTALVADWCTVPAELEECRAR